MRNTRGMTNKNNPVYGDCPCGGKLFKNNNPTEQPITIIDKHTTQFGCEVKCKDCGEIYFWYDEPLAV